MAGLLVVVAEGPGAAVLVLISAGAGVFCTAPFGAGGLHDRRRVAVGVDLRLGCRFGRLLRFGRGALHRRRRGRLRFLHSRLRGLLFRLPGFLVFGRGRRYGLRCTLPGLGLRNGSGAFHCRFRRGFFFLRLSFFGLGLRFLLFFHRDSRRFRFDHGRRRFLRLFNRYGGLLWNLRRFGTA